MDITKGGQAMIFIITEKALKLILLILIAVLVRKILN